MSMTLEAYNVLASSFERKPASDLHISIATNYSERLRSSYWSESDLSNEAEALATRFDRIAFRMVEELYPENDTDDPPHLPQR